MIIGVDASSIGGGGLTHLRGVLGAADPPGHGVSRVRVWAPPRVLDALPERPWLERQSPGAIGGSLARRIAWQRSQLPRLAGGCDLLWAPGGFVPFRASPLVVMSQNSLMFDAAERRRYGTAPMRARLELLRLAQRRSIRRADGVIFLSAWGEELVRRVTDLAGESRVVPHGVDERFLAEPRPQLALERYTLERPLRLLYVSIVDLYKHQWHVAEAVAGLRRRGLPLEIRFVGPAYAPALARFEARRRELDPERRFLHYDGPVPSEDLPALYRDADAFVFASTCENLPNILLEAMASALPIACSDRRPMREMMDDAAVGFDPESPAAIGQALETLVSDPGLRERCARRARSLADGYTWAGCAERTFAFLADVAGRRAA